jgi:hypothetical protein
VSSYLETKLSITIACKACCNNDFFIVTAVPSTLKQYQYQLQEKIPLSIASEMEITPIGITFYGKSTVPENDPGTSPRRLPTIYSPEHSGRVLKLKTFGEPNAYINGTIAFFRNVTLVAPSATGANSSAEEVTRGFVNIDAQYWRTRVCFANSCAPLYFG